MKRKMVLIGAGSAMFTQGVVMDLIHNPGKFSWELVLVDIDEEILGTVHRLVKKILEAKKASHITVWSTKNRAEALPEADYVVCTIGVGGRRAWEQDVFIPRKYGIFQPVGDTAMPGGISRAMRMIPAMLDIIDDCIKFCPSARFFNYANPMAMICRAIYKARSFPVTGLCIGVPAGEWEVADLCGFKREDFKAIGVGVNHMTFLYNMRHKGEDATPIINKVLQEQPVKYNPFAWSFYESHGAYPVPGDRHLTEFFVEGFPGGAYFGKTLGVDAFSFEGTIEYGDKIYKTMSDIANSPEPLTDDYFGEMHGEHEQLMEIINAIEADNRQVFSANLPNRGAVPNLPYDAVLELPAVATGDGFRPMHVLDFPENCVKYVNRAINVFELAVDAALTGNRPLLEDAILAGGYISDKAAVSKMVEELINAQTAYLPQF